MADIGRPGPERSRAPESARERLTGRAILVVDDEPSVRRFVSEVLKQQGHEVIEVAGGREAIRAVYERSSMPDLVVSDVDMPDMSGVELAARLSADRPGIRIVLMTGRPDSTELARKHPEIVSAVLLKPFSLDALLDAVDAALAPTIRPADG